MKNLIASHTRNVYLKPGEVIATCSPALISTVLGSCVAVTMYSPSRCFGAVCHAMLPDNGDREPDLRYVDTALEYIYQQSVKCGAEKDLVVKLFGGARVLDVGERETERQTVGGQNIEKALSILAALELTVSSQDTGGFRGRKLFFCTRSGDVYLRHMRHGSNQ